MCAIYEMAACVLNYSLVRVSQRAYSISRRGCSATWWWKIFALGSRVSEMFTLVLLIIIIWSNEDASACEKLTEFRRRWGD